MFKPKICHILYKNYSFSFVRHELIAFQRREKEISFYFNNFTHHLKLESENAILEIEKKLFEVW
jgi:hypothetical protein